MVESVIVREDIVESVVHIIYIVASAFMIYVLSKAYLTYRLRVFKNAWLVLIASGVIWLISSVSLFLEISHELYDVLLTVFIVVLATGVYMLVKASETVGAV